MVDNPSNMFENDTNLTRMYDFDVLSYQQKVDFIEMVFSRQQSIGRTKEKEKRLFLASMENLTFKVFRVIFVIF